MRKLSEQIVAMVLYQIGVNVTNEEREGAITNVDALLAAASAAPVEQSERIAEEILSSISVSDFREMQRLNRTERIKRIIERFTNEEAR